MKTFEKYEKKILSCLPKNWSDFYKKAPKEFKEDYILEHGFSRDEFLEMAKFSNIFDHSFYEQDSTDSVYKEFEFIPSACDSWFLNQKELDLYNKMPEGVFTQDLLRTTRLSMKLPVSSQDKMTSGTLFEWIRIEGVRYPDLKKTKIKPTLK